MLCKDTTYALASVSNITSQMPSQNDLSIQEQRGLTTDITENSTASEYCPSIFLICALIFWTGISAITEVIIPYDAFVFSIVTYAPTLHFAAQSIVRRSTAGAYPTDILQVSYRARLLAVSWVLNVTIHVGLWWTVRQSAFAGIFLLPTLPGSQAILVMMSIVICYTMDIYMMRIEHRLGGSRDDEETTSIETGALLQPDEPAINYGSVSPQQEGSEAAIQTTSAMSASSPIVPLYQPSISLLCVSISLSLCALILNFQEHTANSSTPILAIIASIQAYIPTILLHSYLILRTLRRDRTETLQHITVIKGFSFDLIPLWLGTEALIAYSKSPDGVDVVPERMVPGGVEALLVVYFAVRYTRSIYAERRRQIRMGITVDDLEPPTDNFEAPSSATQPTDSLAESSTTLYHPSPSLLFISVILSTACLIIESRAEPVCGVPMSAIVYAPTIIIHLHLIYQRYHRTNPSSDTRTPIQKFNASMERSMQLCLIWVLTQVFYVFVWPVSQYLKQKVMNPWVRWAEVVLMLYITARYVRDRQVRNSVGSIRLPPDIEEGDTPIIGPSAVDGYQ